MPNYQTETLLGDSNISMGTEGIAAEGEVTIYDHVATINNLTRRVREGVISSGDQSAPQLSLDFLSTDGPDKLIYGGFEESTLAGWTKTLETSGSWSENTNASFVFGGEKSAKWTVTTTSSHGILTLTTRIAIQGGNAYRFKAKVYADIVAGTTLIDSNFQIKWYAEESGGSVTRTDAVTIDTTPNAWKTYEAKWNAPLAASFAEIVIDVRGYQATAIYFDDLTFSETNVAEFFRMLPTPTLSQLQVITGPLAGGADDGAFLFRPDPSGIPLWRDDTSNLWQGLGINNRGRQLIINTTTKTAIYSITINAGALGQNGFIDIEWTGEAFNNTGSNKTYTFDVDLGGINILTWTATIANSASNGAQSWHLRMYNDGADTFQECIFWSVGVGGMAVNTITVGAVAMARNASNVSTAVDNTFVVSLTLSAASTNYFFEMGGTKVAGPIKIDEALVSF